MSAKQDKAISDGITRINHALEVENALLKKENEKLRRELQTCEKERNLLEADARTMKACWNEACHDIAKLQIKQEECGKALYEFYIANNVITTQDKINALEKELGGPSMFEGEEKQNEQSKLEILEYEYLTVNGIINRVIV